MIFKWL